MRNPPPFASTLRDPAVAQALGGIDQLAQNVAVQGDAVFLKNSLNGGEISPDLGARFDLPRYTQGCQSLLNMIPLPGGGVTKRPGLRYVGNAGAEGRQGKIEGRLYPWTYGGTDCYMLLFMCFEDAETMIYWVDADGTRAPVESGVTLPYKGDDIFDVCCCSVGKFIYMAHPKYPPGRLTVERGPSFRYDVLDFTDQRVSNGINAITEEGQWEPYQISLYYKVAAVDDETGDELLPSEPAEGHFCAPKSVGYHWVIHIDPTPGCSEYRIYKKRGGEYGFIGRITDGSNEFHDFNYDPDTTDPPRDKQEFFQGEGNYPAIVFLHQQRLGWAATLNDPLTLWMSQTSNFNCLRYKTPPADDDGIEVTLASAEAGSILWAVSDRSGLAIGTATDEWYLTGANGENSITPSSLSFQPQTQYGSANIPPLRASSSLLFVQRGGRIIRDLGYSFAADRYEAQDLTLLARHLFRFTRVKDWCWQPAPHNILWVVLQSGKLIGLTYMPDQQLCAWHRHQTNGQFLSCASMIDKSGRERVWFVVRRNIPQPGTGSSVSHCVEIMYPPFEGEPGEWDTPSATYRTYRDGLYNYSFPCRCVPCLPEAQTAVGPSAFKVKKINAVKCRVINSSPFAARITSPYAPPTRDMPVPCPSASANAKNPAYVDQADWACPIPAGFRDDARLELICDGPNPVTILGISVACDVASEIGNQV